MKKNPSTTWYFNDWEDDKELKLCSLEAQGLWMRLLCIAARSPEPGIVQIGTLDMSPPHGLTHIASAVGKPLDVVTPLIDELLTKGVASRDRKGRIYSRRMKARASLSLKRAEAGKLGAEATNGRERRKPDLPQQIVGKPPPLHDSKTFESSSQNDHRDSAARAGLGHGAPPASRLPDSAKWAERLAGHRPWEGVRNWSAEWGPSPESAGTQPFIPPALLADWRERYRKGIEADRERRKAEAA